MKERALDQESHSASRHPSATNQQCSLDRPFALPELPVSQLSALVARAPEVRSGMCDSMWEFCFKFPNNFYVFLS